MVRRAQDVTPVLEWFKEHTGEPLRKELLGPRTYIYWHDELPIASLSLLLDGELSFQIWPITNPKCKDKILRSHALDSLVQFLNLEAKDLGAKWSSIWSSKEVVENRYLNHGYQYGDSPVKQMIKFLGDN